MTQYWWYVHAQQHGHEHEGEGLGAGWGEDSKMTGGHDGAVQHPDPGSNDEAGLVVDERFPAGDFRHWHDEVDAAPAE